MDVQDDDLATALLGLQVPSDLLRVRRQAIVTHGLPQGSWLALKRLLRCRPFSPGGIDPVPELSGHKDA